MSASVLPRRSDVTSPLSANINYKTTKIVHICTIFGHDEDHIDVKPFYTNTTRHRPYSWTNFEHDKDRRTPVQSLDTTKTLELGTRWTQRQYRYMYIFWTRQRPQNTCTIFGHDKHRRTVQSLDTDRTDVQSLDTGPNRQTSNPITTAVRWRGRDQQGRAHKEPQRRRSLDMKHYTQFTAHAFRQEESRPD